MCSDSVMLDTMGTKEHHNAVCPADVMIIENTRLLEYSIGEKESIRTRSLDVNFHPYCKLILHRYFTVILSS